MKNKPASFARISPFGKVPVLFDDDLRVYESAVVNEYLEEKYPSPALMPTSSGDRAHARIWIGCG